MSEGQIVEETSLPRTRESLAHDLRELGVKQGMTIIVHSSFAFIGLGQWRPCYGGAGIDGCGYVWGDDCDADADGGILSSRDMASAASAKGVVADYLSNDASL